MDLNTLFTDIKRTIGPELEARAEAKARLKRMQGELSATRQRMAELQNRITATHKAEIIAIADGNEKAADERRKSLAGLNEQLEAEKHRIQVIEGDGLPMLTKAVQQAQEALERKAGACLDICKLDFESETAAEFDRLLHGFDAFNEAVKSFVAETGTINGEQGLFAASQRLNPVCKSEAMVRHFAQHFAGMGVDVSLWNEQRKTGEENVRRHALGIVGSGASPCSNQA